MPLGDPDGPFLHSLPPAVLWDFCQVMDGLSDRDWTRFASEVLCDQTAVRLAVRTDMKTDRVMNQWANRNGCVKQLIDLLERLQLLRPRDIILAWASNQRHSFPTPPPPPAPAPAAAAAAAAYPPPSMFDPPPKQGQTPTQITCELTTQVEEGGGKPLPRPAPPPSSLQSDLHRPPQPPPAEAACSSGVMCWSYEEVHAGTQGFSLSLRVGEGGFGVVYRATLRNTDCAVKRLKQDSLLDWSLLRESFQTEVDKLSKFRHLNIIDLLGFSEGQGSVCLIYSYMENRSLEDQLHEEGGFLSWSQRVHIIKGASTALQFLHCPPEGHSPLIHGDVKSSNILLDRHLEAKLADFGLARCASRCSSGRSASQTGWVGRTATVRGTLAYLPAEYVRNGQLAPPVDVYSFGVVLLEVLTGRRALEKERYLKNLVDEVEEGPADSSAASWRKQLDQRLISGGATEPAGWLETVALACRCLDRNRKRRPAMTKVFDKLQDVDHMVRMTSSSSPLHHPSQSSPRPPNPLDPSIGALSQQLSKLQPLEDTYQSSSSSSSSSLCSLTPPQPLHSSSSSSLPSHSLLVGPCETDESRGFSQYDLQFRSNVTSSRPLSPSAREPADSQTCHPSVPTEHQYSLPSQLSCTGDTGADGRGQTRAGAAPGGAAGACDVPESLSPAGSLYLSSPGPSVHMNPSKQRLLQKKNLYEEGRIQTDELLSSERYAGRSREESREPEESDELQDLPPPPVPDW